MDQILLKFKKQSEAGHFYSVGRIWPAGHTLPTPITNFWKLLQDISNKSLKTDYFCNEYSIKLTNYS